MTQEQRIRVVRVMKDVLDSYLKASDEDRGQVVQELASLLDMLRKDAT